MQTGQVRGKRENDPLRWVANHTPGLVAAGVPEGLAPWW